MNPSPFTSRITSEAELRALLGEPSEIVKHKQLAALDVHCRAFIGLSPFLSIGTVSATGGCDVSPRGDAPGFTLTLDDRHLAIPERPGNRRADTLRNIMETGSVGLLFLIPGVGEALRVNGRACLTRDPSLLERMTVQGKRPLVAIGVEVEEAFIHCSRAVKRSQLWQPSAWPDHDRLPSLARLLMDQVQPPQMSMADMERYVAQSDAEPLY